MNTNLNQTVGNHKTTHHNTKETIMNAKNNTNRNVRRSFLRKVAIALTVAVLSMPYSSKALTYVNLLDEPAPRDNGPVSLSYGATSGPAVAIEPTPEPVPQTANDFAAYTNNLLNGLRQNEQFVLQQSSQYDGLIHEQEVAREMARSNWLALHTNDAVLRYWAADAQIQQYQLARQQMLAMLYQTNVKAFNDLYSRDPNAQANVSWYQYWVGVNQSKLNYATQCENYYTTLYGTAATNYQNAAVQAATR